MAVRFDGDRRMVIEGGRQEFQKLAGQTKVLEQSVHVLCKDFKVC
jgi:hypothetical protein